MFDTGPLRHFAQAGWLGVLEEIVGERRAIAPAAVLAELESTSRRFPEVADAVNAHWVTHYELSSYDEIAALAMFGELLVSGRKNRGEAEVLALAATLPAEAVIDDSTAFEVGKREGVTCTRTLPLLCDAMHRGLLSLDEVSDIADDLITTDYRLPFEPGQFVRWATDEGFLATPEYDSGSSSTAEAS
ncbi:hypothetical protein [Candidatus Poriferisodalis sp.]|uniref:hypothetical protein n=1 Tax=Candidatus Poriferisodalis sp. TaxID=3101277 RepID=UPI003B5BE924